MKLKTFTLKEANKLIPIVKNAFDDLFVLKKKIGIMKSEVDWIRDFWGKDMCDSDNPDGEKHDKLLLEVEKLYKEIKKKVIVLQKQGYVVKDVDNGLVDFYSFINNEPVFLCWQYGEKKIEYWHAIDGGFNGRRPITKINKIE